MKRMITLIVIFLMLILTACGNSESGESVSEAQSGSALSEFSATYSGENSRPSMSEGNGSTASESVSSPQNESSRTGSQTGESSTQTSSSPSSETSKEASKDTSKETSKPSGSDSTPTSGDTGNKDSNVQYSDGNIYVLTDDKYYIIKIDLKFSGNEILYERNGKETISQPIYRNGYVFFKREMDNEPSKIYRVDVKTKKVTTVLSSNQVPESFSDLGIVGNQIYIRTYKDGDKISYYMCNLDGSGFRKTSAVDVDLLSLCSNEYNGKIYMVSYYSYNYVATFYEMNVDGTGFKKLFTMNHYLCRSFGMLGVVNGEIYYNAYQTKNGATTNGMYKVKLDGSGQKRIQIETMSGAATDGNYLYLCPDDMASGISRVDKNGTVTNNLALKGAELYSLTYLHNGFMYAECEDGYIVSVPDLKVYKVADYSPTSPFAQYQNGVNILSLPTKTSYKVGEGFDITGFSFVYYDKYTGTISSAMDPISFVTTDGVTLTQGRPFTMPGTKQIQIRYYGQIVATYTVYVS